MNVHLIHGFNVRDGGMDTVGRMGILFELAGYNVIRHDYGWVGPLRLRWRNDRVVKALLPQIQEGDILLAHSNGCLISWLLTEAGAPVSAVICVQPALRRDTEWCDGVEVLCFYNPLDWVVSLGRAWGRFWSTMNPWRDRHGWGSAGRHGFNLSSSETTDVNTANGPHPATYHGGMFEVRALLYWFDTAEEWLKARGLDPV